MTRWCVLETPLTCVGIVAEHDNPVHIRLLRGPLSLAEAHLRLEYPAADEDSRLLPELQRELLAYFERRPFRFPRSPRLGKLTEFQQTVLAACGRIPAGRTLTYSELAAKVGRPGAARAVGNALARNPLPIVIPCHRVVAGNRKLGGFSADAGVVLERELLALEGVELPA